MTVGTVAGCPLRLAASARQSVRKTNGPVVGAAGSYATVRSAATRYAAEHLVAVPRDAKGIGINVPPADNSSVLGALDAVATDVCRDLGDKRATGWKSAVFERSTAGVSAPPAYAKDPVGHLVDSWRQTLRESGPALSADTFGQQSADMADAWAKARGLNDTMRVELRQNALQVTASTRIAALPAFS